MYHITEWERVDHMGELVLSLFSMRRNNAFFLFPLPPLSLSLPCLALEAEDVVSSSIHVVFCTIIIVVVVTVITIIAKLFFVQP